MASSSTFGFNYDEDHDIDPSSNDVSLHLDSVQEEEPATMEPEPQLEVPKLHSLQEMISYIASSVQSSVELFSFFSSDSSCPQRSKCSSLW